MDSTIVPYQKWCGQTQPHNQHIWADIKSNSIGLNLNCAGFSCLDHVVIKEGVEKEVIERLKSYKIITEKELDQLRDTIRKEKEVDKT